MMLFFSYFTSKGTTASARADIDCCEGARRLYAPAPQLLESTCIYMNAQCSSHDLEEMVSHFGLDEV